MSWMPQDAAAWSLRDGRTLQVGHWTYPLPVEHWTRFLTFWKTEWAHTDVDWLEALRGSYADTLTIEMVYAALDGQVVGTASVYFPKVRPEVCVVADVLTSPTLRGMGIAARLTDLAVQRAFGAGCRVAYLGNKPTPHCAYEKAGFQRIRGAVMRRARDGHENCETDFYAPGQQTTVRLAVWGDLPGVACLMAQPLSCWFADYPRGLVSLQRATPTRCVSNFTSVHGDVERSGGAMFTLVGELPYRLLGFGSLTPGPAPARAHIAVVDAVTHDRYEDKLPLLIATLVAEGRARKLEGLEAFIACTDEPKAERFRQAGFHPVATLSSDAKVDGKDVAVSVWWFGL